MNFCGIAASHWLLTPYSCWSPHVLESSSRWPPVVGRLQSPVLQSLESSIVANPPVLLSLESSGPPIIGTLQLLEPSSYWPVIGLLQPVVETHLSFESSWNPPLSSRCTCPVVGTLQSLHLSSRWDSPVVGILQSNCWNPPAIGILQSLESSCHFNRLVVGLLQSLEFPAS